MNVKRGLWLKPDGRGTNCDGSRLRRVPAAAAGCGGIRLCGSSFIDGCGAQERRHGGQ